MVSRHRISGVYIFLGIILAALAIFGCSGSGDDPLVTGPGSYGSISGTVQAPVGGGAVREVDASVVSAVNLTRAYVFLEKYPQIATYSNSNGKFTLSPVTFEQHNVIVKLTGSGSTIYKVRSFNVDVTSTQPAKDTGNLQVKLADRKVRIRVNDGGTSSTIASATIRVWGETFTYIGNGEYESPVLPADETATITVDVAGRTQVQMPAQFVSTTPPVLETAVPPAGSTNTPPTVTLAASSLVVNNGVTITFTATARDPENDSMTYQWESSSGSLSTTTSGLQATWTAPSSGTGSATITFKAIDAGGLFARTTLTVGYMPVANQKPVVDIVADSSTLTGGIAYALVASATDPDGNISAATYLWSVPSGSLSTTAQSITDWTTPAVTATTSVIVSLTVTDTAGDSTTKTRTFSVIPAPASPTATITRPTTNEIFPAGSVQFTGQVKLADNSVLSTSYYHWLLTYPGGSTSEIASRTNNFYLSLSTPGNYTIWLTATSSEGLGCVKSVPFKINYPPQSLGISKSPNQVSFLASTAITLSASASDPENDTISYKWYDYSFILNATSTLGTGQTISAYKDFAAGSHTVTLAAADTRNGVSSASIVIEIAPNAAPHSLDITIAPPGTSFLASAAISFTGSATDTEGQAISYTWYDYSHMHNATATLGTGETVTNYRDFVPGSHTITLTAMDTFDAVASSSIIIGIATNSAPQNLTITRSPSKPNYLASEAVTFTGGATDPEGQTFTYAWEDYSVALNATTTFGTTQTVSNYRDLAAGNHVVTMTTTDSFGASSSTSVAFAVGANTAPTVTLTNPPAGTTWYFSGQTVPFSGYATDVEDGGYVATASLNWSITGPGGFNHDPTGTASFALQPATPGTYTIRLFAVDSLNATGSRTRSLYINATPTVTIDPDPASGTRYNTGEQFTLTASIGDEDSGEALSIVWRDATTGTDLGNTTLVGPWPKTHTLTTSRPQSGYHNITARVIDSCGVSAIATRSLLINNLPVPNMTIGYPQYATTPGGNRILLASSSVAINLTASANDAEDGSLAANRLSCILTGTGISQTTYAGVSAIPSQYLDPGTYNLMVEATDLLGSSNAATFTFVVWNAETYLSHGTADSQLSSPSAIILDGSSYFVTDSGNSKLKKFTANFTLENAIGELGTDPGSFTALVGVTKYGNTIYTLEGFPLGAPRIQTWDDATFAPTSQFGGQGVPAIGNALYTSPSAITTNGTNLYICDPAANLIERLDMNTGVAANIITNPNGTAFNGPSGIRVLNSSVYVADRNTQRIVVCTANLSFTRSWNASHPSDITAYGSYFITTDPTGNKIQIWDNSGVHQADIGAAGSALGKFDTPISVISNNNKLVILENGKTSDQARIHVFTLPSATELW